MEEHLGGSGAEVGVVPPLAVALRRALGERGMTASDLVRELGYPAPATVRQAIAGLVLRPNRELRDALDRYFGAPAGHTLRIVEGRVRRWYPAPERTARLAHAAAGMSDEAVELLIELLEVMSAMPRERASASGRPSV